MASPPPATGCRRRFLVLFVGVGLMMVLTACEPGPETVTTLDTRTTTTLTARETVDGFRACLAEGGVNIPPIRFGPDDRPIFDAVARLGTSDPAVSQLLTACVGPLAERGLLELDADPALRTAVMSDLRVFAQCMRDQGIGRFPDPVEDYDGSGAAFPPDAIPRNADGFQAAVSACTTGAD